MASSELSSASTRPGVVNAASGKPRILIAASGSVAAVKFAILCRTFSEWAEVKAVATETALRFIDMDSFPKDVILYTDKDEWYKWRRLGGTVLHIELCKWADIMVIAPLSANTLAKIAGGLCDNLLTCIVRAWDYKKPFFVSTSMNTLMWKNPFTERHLMIIEELGIFVIFPAGRGVQQDRAAMAEPSEIYNTIRLHFDSMPQQISSDIH